MNIYIVRHGQTNWNKEGRYTGRLNIQINDKGIEQAYITKEKLKNITFDKIYSSPLIRAIKTAKIIRNQDIIIDERIIERSNGDLEGKLKTEIKDIIDFNDPNSNKYNIEPIDKFRKRINNFLDEITSDLTSNNILIVTHAGVGIYMRCYFEGEPPNKNYNKYKINNCEIIKYNDKRLSSNLKLH